MAKILAVQLIYNPGDITYLVAVEDPADHQHYQVYKNHAPSISQYMINRTIEEGKMATIEEAVDAFSNTLSHCLVQP